MALLALMTMTAACGDGDEPDRTAQATIDNVVTKTVAGTTGTAFDVNSSLAFNLNYTARTADVTTHGVKFSPNQPVGVDLLFKGCKATFASDDHVTFSGTGFTPMEGYTVNDVSGSFNTTLNTGIMRYTVVSPRSTSQVYAFTQMLYSTLPNQATNYNGDPRTAERFYKFQYGLNQDNKVMANIYIDNIQFVPQMPKLAEIRIPLDNAEVVSTKTGYEVTGNGIVPYYLQGNTEVPMDSRTIDNLKAQVNVDEATFHIEFDCFGLHFTEDGNIYR